LQQATTDLTTASCPLLSLHQDGVLARQN
jgi:hypothetical protein